MKPKKKENGIYWQGQSEKTRAWTSRKGECEKQRESSHSKSICRQSSLGTLEVSRFFEETTQMSSLPERCIWLSSLLCQTEGAERTEKPRKTSLFVVSLGFSLQKLAMSAPTERSCLWSLEPLAGESFYFGANVIFADEMVVPRLTT